jgi:hypothetical protein
MNQVADDLVKGMINQYLKRPLYLATDPAALTMLSWNQPLGIQFLTDRIARVGTIGDGNCLLHAILFATSPSYRACSQADRRILASQFREYLKAHEDALRDEADALYAEEGGSEIFDHSFITLHDTASPPPEELDIEMGLFVAAHLELNFLAVKLTGDPADPIEAVCLTFKGYKPDRDTILVNYYGGGVDFGAAAIGQSFTAGGHYEAVVDAVTMPTKLTAPKKVLSHSKTVKASSAASASAAKKKTTSSGTRKRTKGFPVILNDGLSSYLFTHDQLVSRGILDLFEPRCADEAAASVLAAVVEAAAASKSSSTKKTSSKKTSSKKSSSSLLSLPSSPSSETKKKLVAS